MSTSMKIHNCVCSDSGNTLFCAVKVNGLEMYVLWLNSKNIKLMKTSQLQYGRYSVVISFLVKPKNKQNDTHDLWMSV